MGEAKMLTHGLKLFQPWATDIVRGKMNLLVRSINVKIRGRVAVIATKGIDNIWLKNASDKEMKEIGNIKVGGIGSVEIKDCIKVKPDKIKEKIIDLAGKEYWDYYPKYLIPSYSRTGNIYIWVLDQAKEWSKEKPISGGGFIWAKIRLEDG